MFNERGEGPVLRQRILDELQPLAPLTILAGIPGTSKGTLITQLYQQMSARSDGGPIRVLVDLPRKHLGVKNGIAFATECIVRALYPERLNDPGFVELRRGRVDLAEVSEQAAGWTPPAQGVQIFMPNYEWHVTPELESLLLSWVRSGLDVVCSMVDPEALIKKAHDAGIMVRVVTDADLCFRADELAELSKVFGVEPSSALIARVSDLACGHPLISSVFLMSLSGIDKVVVDRGAIRLLGGDLPDGQMTGFDLESRRHYGETNLEETDVSRLGESDGAVVAALLRLQEAEIAAFKDSPQGHSPFMKLLTSLITVPSIDLDALEDIIPVAPGAIQRLTAAGYGRLEFSTGPVGRFVWNEGFRRVASHWDDAHGPEDIHDDSVSEFFRAVLGWYAEHGRFDAARQLIRTTSTPVIMEEFLSTWSTDLMGTGVLRDLPIRFPATVAEAVSFPATTILAGMGASPSFREEPETRRIVESLVPGLLELSVSDEPEKSLRGSILAMLALGVLDRWGDERQLADLAWQALEKCRTMGVRSGAGLGRDRVLLGIEALIRADFDTAERALTRAIGECRGDTDALKLARIGLLAVDGCLGEPILPLDTEESMLFGPGLPEDEVSGQYEELKVLISVARAWSAVQGDEYDRALTVMEDLVATHPWEVSRPVVIWTYGLMLVLNGRADEARSIHLEADRRAQAAGRKPLDSPIFVLGAVLASAASGRLNEATVLASRREGGVDKLDAFVQLAISLASGKVDRPVLMERRYWRRDQHRSKRVQTLLTLHWISASLRARHESDAEDALRALELAGPGLDIGFACRLMTKADTVRVRELAVKQGHGQIATEIQACVEGPHIADAQVMETTFSKSQQRVLELLAQGLKNQEIADALYLSVNTVKTHLREINLRLGATNRHEAVSKARELGLLRR